MALGDSYATLTELKTRLQIPDNADNDRLTEALAAASRGVEEFCNRQFNDAGSASARVYRPDSGRLVKVDDCHTTAPVVTVDGTTYPSTDYELEPLNGVVDGQPGWPYWRIRLVNRVFPWSRKANVSVTARWGWAVVPAPVKEATLIAAEEVFKLRDTPFGVGGYGDFGIVRVRDNPFISRMLSTYQRDPWLVA